MTQLNPTQIARTGEVTGVGTPTSESTGTGLVRVLPWHRGVSTPAEYEPAQHVDPAVIDTVAEWLGASRRKISRWRVRPKRA